MSGIIRIPILNIEISVNTLITVIILLCIFFTFFSVTIELGGNLNPATVAEEDSNCNDIAIDQIADLTQEFKSGVRKTFGEIKSTLENNDAINNYL